LTDYYKLKITCYLKNYFILKINTIEKKQKNINRKKYANLLNSSTTYSKLKKDLYLVISEFKNLRPYTTALFLFFDFLFEDTKIESINEINKDIIIKFINLHLKKKRHRTKISYTYKILNFFNYLEEEKLSFNFSMKDFKNIIDDIKIKETKMTVSDIINSNINIKNIISLIYSFSRNKDGSINYNKRLQLKVMLYGSFSVKEIENIKTNDCIKIKINEHICIKIRNEQREVYIKYTLIKKEFEYSYLNNKCKTNNLFYTSMNNKYSNIAIYKLVNRFLTLSDLKFDLHTFVNYFPIFLFHKNLSIENVLSILGYVDQNIQTLYLTKKNKLFLEKQEVLQKYN
jgi:hypothetical protein